MRFGGVVLLALVGCSKREPSPPVGTVLAPTGGMYLLVDDEFAYVAGWGLAKVSLDGGAQTVLVAQTSVAGEAMDSDAIYVSTYSGANDGVIERVPKDGSTAQVLATAPATPVAVDDSYVYWQAKSGFMRILKTGGTPELLTAAQDSTWAIAVDDTDLYWATFVQLDAGISYNALVSHVPKDGGAPEVLSDMAIGLTRFGLDDGGVYWNECPPTGGVVCSLVRFDKATKQSRAVLSKPSLWVSNAIVIDSARVYSTDVERIDYTPISGGTATLVAKTSTDTPDVKVRSGNVYWLDYDYDGGVMNLRTIPTP